VREYRILRSGVTLFLAGYFVGGLLTLLHPREEVFPVYSWFLFALVPQRQTLYAVVLHEAEGRPLPQPIAYQEAINIVRDPHNVVVHQLIQQLGAAVEKQDVAQVTELRRLLETNYLPARSRYEVAKISYEPLRRWRTGEQRTERLAMFSTEAR
jgi:hypothetical protein